MPLAPSNLAMLYAADIATALKLTGVVLLEETLPNGETRATITANEPVTEAMQAKVQAWHEAGRIVVRPEYVEQREAAYIAEGITPDSLAIALAEKDGEGKPDAFNALQAKRAAIKLRYPKL
jgi:hypothetical protein